MWDLHPSALAEAICISFPLPYFSIKGGGNQIGFFDASRVLKSEGVFKDFLWSIVIHIKKFSEYIVYTFL